MNIEDQDALLGLVIRRSRHIFWFYLSIRIHYVLDVSKKLMCLAVNSFRTTVVLIISK